MPNKRTGPDYQDYQKKKQREIRKDQAKKHNKEMHEEYMRNYPPLAPKPKAKPPAKPKAKLPAKPKAKLPAKRAADATTKKPTTKKKTESPQELLLRDKGPKKTKTKPKMGSAEDWADLRSRIKKAKEKEKKNRKTLPYTI
tara:strand:+ start:93 stop:515 length:423 start_codon:yes stop_codon:yes gene_type:complete